MYKLCMEHPNAGSLFKATHTHSLPLNATAASADRPVIVLVMLFHLTSTLLFYVLTGNSSGSRHVHSAGRSCWQRYFT